MTTISVAGSTQLLNAMKTAKGGDTILLAAGSYGNVTFSRLSYGAAVTIKSADAKNPAVFSGISFSSANNIKLDGIKLQLTPTADTYAWSSAMAITSSSNITVANSTLRGGLSVNGVPQDATELDASGNVLGLPVARAATITSSTNVSFVNDDISLFHKGLVLSSVDGLTVANSDIHNLRSTPISGGNVSNLNVTNNHLHDSTPWQFTLGGDHGDFVHIWTSPTLQTAASANITISGNFTDQGMGDPLLGIYLDDNTNAIGFTNVKITDNVLFNDDGQGIRLENSHGVVVTDNTLIHSRSTYGEAPAVVFTNGTDGITFTRNILSGAPSNSLAADANGNLLLQREDANAANYYGKVFVNALTRGANLADLRIQPGSPVAGSGMGSNLLDFPASSSTAVAAFTTSDNPLDHKAVAFDASLSQMPSGDTATYSWSFGDGSTATGQKASHSYASTGNYTATLTMTDARGTVSISKHDLKVVDQNLLHIDFEGTGISETSCYASAISGDTDASFLTQTDRGTVYHLTGTNSIEACEQTANQIFDQSRFTLSFSLQRDSATGGTGSLMRIQGGWSVTLNTKGELEFAVTSQAGTSYKITGTGIRITDTAVHAIDLTYDASLGKAIVYVDGAASGSGTISGPTRMIASWGFAVGNPYGASAQAKIGDVSLIDQAKSATQVATDYSAMLSAFAPKQTLASALSTTSTTTAKTTTTVNPFATPTSPAALTLASAVKNSLTSSLVASRLH